jgi:hypothetical protein
MRSLDCWITQSPIHPNIDLSSWCASVLPKTHHWRSLKMNDETALRELLSMSRIYNSRGQDDKAEECMALAQQIQQRLTTQSTDLEQTASH